MAKMTYTSTTAKKTIAEIVAYLVASGPATAADVAAHIGLSKKSTHRYLAIAAKKSLAHVHLAASKVKANPRPATWMAGPAPKIDARPVAHDPEIHQITVNTWLALHARDPLVAALYGPARVCGHEVRA